MFLNIFSPFINSIFLHNVQYPMFYKKKAKTLFKNSFYTCKQHPDNSLRKVRKRWGQFR